jgi:hypothetical protein
VPLGWIARGQLVGFDLHQDGASLPLLLASEIEVVTRQLLELELELALRRKTRPSDSDLSAEAFALIEDAVRYTVPPDVVPRIDAFRRRYGSMVDDLAELLRASAAGYLLLALIPRVDRRQLVKFAHDVAVPLARRRASFWFETPGVLEAASSHLEGPLPVELRAATWRVATDGGTQVLVEGPSNSDHPVVYVTREGVLHRLESLAGSVGGASQLGISARFRVERWRFHVPGTALSVVATTLLAYGAFVADLDATAEHGNHGPVVTVLLASVALFLALLLRLDEHSLARRMLLWPRWFLGLVLLAVLSASSALAFGGAHVEDVWRGATYTSAAFTLLIAVSTVGAAGGASERSRPKIAFRRLWRDTEDSDG